MIHEFDKIDKLAINAYDNTLLHLFIFDHMEWNDVQAHWAILQMKTENYVTFIKQKGYIAPLSKDFNSFEIIIYSAYEAPKSAVKLMRSYQKQLNRRKYPITLKYEFHPM